MHSESFGVTPASPLEPRRRSEMRILGGGIAQSQNPSRICRANQLESSGRRSNVRINENLGTSWN
jgi:hypothetical protein